MNNDTILDCMIMLQSAYPRTNVSKETMRIYEVALADIDPGLLETAVLRHISISKWFPTIAELRQGVTELILEAEGHLDGPEAWGMVTQEIRRVGHWGRPELSDHVRRAINAIGGWQELCLSENAVADRARFIEAYNIIHQRTVEKRQQMPAVTEAQESLATGKDRVHQEIAKLLSGKRPER